ncbi:hypothetical protein AMAG_17812 [Allomyces macrogynus ATCC 38327]|uniref:Uncharacterized protein n=1 Tax=Allomyces macrogynus (strain ATCC 38327) TaxID=578462 RepID=A0A0L0RZF0_ALLM3|nr:hypothetical protein AMAG_17812 [Allomyces macrogynus ATCC 38327]|eukprot:KNE55708.1 hypothetical protein AMAG_17812 [Allomyces macrogynus ATCC 38327]
MGVKVEEPPQEPPLELPQDQPEEVIELPVADSESEIVIQVHEPLEEFVFEPLLKEYVHDANDKPCEKATKKRRENLLTWFKGNVSQMKGSEGLDIVTEWSQLFDLMNVRQLKDTAAALNSIKLSGKRFSNVDIEDLHHQCHEQRKTKDKMTSVLNAKKPLVVSLDQCKAYAATVPVQPLPDSLLAIFISAAVGLWCDPVYLTCDKKEEYPYLEVEGEHLWMRGPIMSAKAKDKGYSINVLIDPAFASHITASVQEHAKTGQKFVFADLVDEDKDKSFDCYSRLIRTASQSIPELNGASTVNFRKAHVTHDLGLYKRNAMTYEELNARFSARGHSLAVLDHYYRPDAE